MCLEIFAPPAPLANSSMMSTLTAHCQWKGETVRESSGHPTSYAVAKKMKSLTLHTCGYPIGLFSSPSSVYCSRQVPLSSGDVPFTCICC